MSMPRRIPAAGQTDTLNHYIQEIRRFPRLSPDEEKQLGRRIQGGDENALRKLVECNLRFVVSFAKRYRGLGPSLLDLIHEGNLGLMQAARRFDPERNVKFISYAVWWVRQCIVRAVSEHNRIFRVPVRMSRAFGRMERQFEAESREKGTPAPEEVAASLDVSLDDVNTFLAISGMDVSLSDPVGEDSGLELADSLAQDAIPPVEGELIRKACMSLIRQWLQVLGPKEAEVIRLRFGLSGEEPRTLQAIGERLHISRERVRQIESQALTKLRRSSYAPALRGFLN
ncbi:MAG: RNA polymerase sigma factor RpoD/SigA [Acidobacteriota bacterium]